MRSEDKKALIDHRISKAKGALDDVEFLINNKKFLFDLTRR